MRDIYELSRRADIFILLASEEVKADKMNLGVTLFTSVGHVGNLARAVLDHSMAVLAYSREYHRVGGSRSAGGLFDNISLQRDIKLAWQDSDHDKLCKQSSSQEYDDLDLAVVLCTGVPLTWGRS